MEHNNIYRSVFKVTHSGGSGSCFYLKNYDLFVTNYHVVEGYRTVAVHDNDRNPYLAKVVLVNPALDIALLAAEGDFSALPEMTLAADDSLTIGRKVYLSLIHISEPTRLRRISYAVFCLKKKTLSLVHLNSPVRRTDVIRCLLPR